MNPTFRATIRSVASYVPDSILSNDVLEQWVDTSQEWIESRTGILERRILTDSKAGTSFLAVKAVQALLKKSGVSPDSIDLLICATVTPDMLFPATANIVSDLCGITRAYSYDLNAACSGFLFALAQASAAIECGRAQRVIVVGADKMSSIINYEDRQTCIIFGDGAGAVLMEACPPSEGFLSFRLHTDGSGRHFLYQPAGGSAKPPTLESVLNHEHFVVQEGQTVFKFAVGRLSEVVLALLEELNIAKEDIQWLVPHQANKRIIDALSQRLEMPAEKVMLNIHKFGNTTNATLPLCLSEYENQLKAGDLLVLATFGGGFTWGAAALRWSYNS